MRPLPIEPELAQRIVAACAEACGLSVAQMVGRGRWTDVVLARTAAAKMLRDRGLAYRHIAPFIGRDHTVMYSYIKKSGRMRGALKLVLDRAYTILTRDRHKAIASQQQPKCSERGCPMPAGIDGYCRQHWAMRETPKLFETYVVKSMGGWRASSAGRRPLIRSIY